ncbi:hypothetical protein JZ751_012711 [Albula glossodonta]|uniref:FAM124 domain-containing protein n=1 Tax=Albula glossodonta TaxID=121402 RepID=A0A8T2MYK7_9TELE|nr:hypothetical protein JZ751_012711 [Albula glossodonta]
MENLRREGRTGAGERGEGGERLMGGSQDPFLVSVHIITDPGQAKLLQRAADALLSCIHPELQLFRVSERAAWQPRPKPPPPSACASTSDLQRAPPPQPALAVILFLQEEYGGEEQLLRLHRALQRPPWRYHHTERVNGRLLPLAPCSQDFFTLAPGTPLWAVRQVHYGKEMVRFTVYCRHQSFSDMVRLYGLLLRRPLAQRKDDFCFYVVYSNPDTEIQLSFKRLPRGQNPAPTSSAVVEFRVRDVDAFSSCHWLIKYQGWERVTALGYPLCASTNPLGCTPLAQVELFSCGGGGSAQATPTLHLSTDRPECVRGSAHCRRRHTIGQLNDLLANNHSLVQSPAPAPNPVPPYGRGPPSYRNRRFHRNSSRARHQSRTQPPSRGTSQPDLPQACEAEAGQRRDSDAAQFWWAGPRTRSLFTLSSVGGARSAPCSPSPSLSSAHSRRSSLAPPFRLNVDALVGAVETDVDTGRKMDSGAVDFSVVSAYSRPLPPPPRPLSATLRNGHTFSAMTTPAGSRKPRPHSDCLPVTVWDGGRSPGTLDHAPQDTPAEEEQEFYI